MSVIQSVELGGKGMWVEYCPNEGLDLLQTTYSRKREGRRMKGER